MLTIEESPSASLGWHARPADATLDALQSRPEGLTADEAARRLQETGPNVLPRSSGPGIPELLWRQIKSPLVLVLIGTAALALLLGKTTDGLVVFGVVVLNTLIGFFQEYRAGRAIEALQDMVPEQATVLRGGETHLVPAADLVPGDVVLLQPGDRIPADLRLLHARGLRVEEAALTGESVPAEKTTHATADDAALGDRHGMSYSGTLVAAGTGRGVVVATGVRTELGRISEMINAATSLETPLTQQMEKLGGVLTLAIGAVALLLLGVGLWRGETLVDAIIAAITMAVAAIPEGLPAIITIALAIGVQRMARRHALVRRLPSVETLGATTVICSDKTGTLTRGEMTVRTLWTPRSGRLTLTGSGYDPEGRLVQEDAPVHDLPQDVTRLLEVGALCNDARLGFADGTWQITGDPTEGALVVSAEKAGLSAQALRTAWPRLDVVPFSSERQLMATLHRAPDGSHVLLLKGAPEAVISRSLSEGGMPGALGVAGRMATEGLRVLGMALKHLPDGRDTLEEADLDRGFTFLGLQGMIDPPRTEAIDAVAACQQAGIEVKMITGDHPLTAHSIGQQLGLAEANSRAVTGNELEDMDEAELNHVARHERVFARVAPEHKLRLVRALQTQRHVVAMTGDGVNDAPALKQADIGVAMGLAGTAAAKESSDMVLTDDNFASIAAAVEEGRRIYDNLVKSLAFVLPTNIGEALIILAAVLFFPIVGGHLLLPMLPTQILWINLVATVTLALPLAFEAMEPSVMNRPPRRPQAPILDRFVLLRTIGVAILMAAGAIALFLYEHSLLLETGFAPAEALARAQTVAVTTVVLFQCFYLLQCRSLTHSAMKIGLWSNPWVYAGIAALLVLQLVFVYAPVMHTLFGSAPLSAGAWGRALLAALVVVPVIGLEKRLRRRAG